MKPHIESGDLVAIGVVQEQHPDRARLYKQWRQLDWPILVDSLNTIEHIRVVPVPMAIDEYGIVRDTSFRPNELDAFVDAEYDVPEIPEGYNVAPNPDWEELLQAEAIRRLTPEAAAKLRFELGASFFNHGTEENLTQAVDSLRTAATLDESNARYHFALGSALRRRYESAHRQAGDQQSAVRQWARALELDPNHYIYRRRLQQYGPRLDKPYNFYFWVEEARKDIRARGGTPHPLTAEPMGSELAPPQRQSEATETEGIPNPDPLGRIHRDEKGLVGIETMVTPEEVSPGNRARIRVTFRLDPERSPWWNNEADRLRMWIATPDGLEVAEHDLTWPNPEEPETRELRQLELEVQVPEGTADRTFSLPAYALYYVCENAGGVCYFLRQDFDVSVTVDSDAPELQ